MKVARRAVVRRAIMLTFFVTATAPIYCASAVSQSQGNEVLLWPHGAPGARGERAQDKPSITPYPSAGNRSSAAMIVCPGGGYSHLAAHEGAPVAEWLNGLGIHAFVLKYRLGSDGYRHPAMLQDVQRAIRQVRSHAGDFGVDPGRIGVLGFSAGGHLASSAATRFDRGDSSSTDPVERVSSRPDLMVLVYPVITMGELGHADSRENLLGKHPSPELVKLMSNELQVTRDTPPAFLVHTANDNAVPVENSLMFASSLQHTGVGVELHIFETGPKHGFGLAASDPVVSVWPKLCERWLKTHGF